MFTRSARYYDLMKSSKNYQKESTQIIDILNHSGISNGAILDLACGTGEHDRYLKSKFQIDGLDLNEELIGIARVKNPECAYYLRDMIDFEIDKSYDAIICLYGSVGYTKSLKNLSRMIACCKKHLKKNGLLIIEPWYSPDNWEANNIHTISVKTEFISITRMGIGNTDGDIVFHYLIGENKKGVEYFTEMYEFGLFTHKELMETFHENKLNAIFMKNTIQKRGLYIGKLC